MGMKSIMDWKSLSLASLCGVRIFTPWGILSGDPRANIPKLAQGLMIGEWVYDQSPNAVDRIDPIPLLSRIVSGACMALEIAEPKTRKEKALVSTMGAVSAASVAYTSFYLRKYLHEQQGLPGSFLGSLEDAVVAYFSIEQKAKVANY